MCVFAGLLLASVLALVPRAAAIAVEKTHRDTLLLFAVGWAEDHLGHVTTQATHMYSSKRHVTHLYSERQLDADEYECIVDTTDDKLPPSLLLSVAAGLAHTLVTAKARPARFLRPGLCCALS